MASGDVCRVSKPFRSIIWLVLLLALMVAAACGDPVDKLMKDLQTGNDYAKGQAIDKLVIIGRLAVVPLISALKNPDPNVRSLAARGLGRIHDPRAVEPLIMALKDPESKVRRQASKAFAFWIFRDARPLKPLIATLKDPDPDVREYAAMALGRIGDARAMAPLIAAFSDPEPEVGRLAAGALVKINDVQAVAPLTLALKDQKAQVRRNAAYAFALWKIGGARAVESLIAALQDPDPDVRGSVAQALGEIGSARAVEPLIAALKDPEVRAAAAEALSDIGDSSAVPGLVENLIYWPSRKEVGAALTRFSWKPRTEEEKVHFWVATSNVSSLISQWSLTKKVLLQDIQSGNKDRIEYTLFAFISIGKEDIIPELVQIMIDRGDKTLAEAYLNCGHRLLSTVANGWAERHGYRIVKGDGSAPVVWGRMN